MTKATDMKSRQNNIIQEITPLANRECLYIAKRVKDYFTYPIHSHVEFALNLIVNARGVKRIVGDSSEVIGNYDLVLITGANLEHAWEQYECKGKDMEEITIQFNWDFEKDDFFLRNQFDSIRQMIIDARVGLAFKEPTVRRVYPLLEDVVNESDQFRALLKFLEVLYIMSQSDDAYQLASPSFANVDAKSDSRRILKVQSYIDSHFKEELRLPVLASMVNMTPVSFSRFFKLRTGRNVSEYIIDIRLGHASRMLVDSTDSIAEVCYGSGFNNLSNFNRIFRKKKKCSPKEFREQYHKKNKTKTKI